MPVTVFVAAKFEALHSRGGNDLRYAHDFEDIIYILNGCNDFLTKCANEENEELKSYFLNKYTDNNNAWRNIINEMQEKGLSPMVDEDEGGYNYMTNL